MNKDTIKIKQLEFIRKLASMAAAHPKYNAEFAEKVKAFFAALSTEQQDAAANIKAAAFMQIARNSAMLMEVRDLVSTLTDPKANCPGRTEEARRLLPLLDAYLGQPSAAPVQPQEQPKPVAWQVLNMRHPKMPAAVHASYPAFSEGDVNLRIVPLYAAPVQPASKPEVWMLTFDDERHFTMDPRIADEWRKLRSDPDDIVALTRCATSKEAQS